VAAVDSAVLLVFEHDPTARLECLASNGSRDLTYFQANVYKGLNVLRHITFSVPIPWTSGSLWQWFTGSVRGIRFQNRSDATCCFSDLMILFPTTNAAAHPEQVIFTKLTDLSSFMTIVVHEARHANGNSYPLRRRKGPEHRLHGRHRRVVLFQSVDGRADAARVYPGAGANRPVERCAHSLQYDVLRAADV
jgi:hypothetical protein